MLAYIVAEGRGEADRCLVKVSEDLRARGVKLAGAVQFNIELQAEYKCQMDLEILNGSDVVRISQDLGALSQGCRLDPEGLERAVGLVGAALDQGADLLIINKFGKQEVDGRGFRPLIGEALGRGIPVITAVARGNVDGFEAFAEGMATRLQPKPEIVIDWFNQQTK